MKYFLHTDHWARAQEALGHRVHRRAGEGWEFLAIEDSNPAGKLLYLPYGPVAESLRSFDQALVAARELARDCGAVFLRCEPVQAGLPEEGYEPLLEARGLRRAPSNQQPELSWVVDLDASEQEILADMKSTNRNLYRNIHKKGVTFRKSTDPADLDILLGFLHATAARNGFKAQSDDYLRTVAENLLPAGAGALFIAELEGTPIAAAFTYDSEDTRVYAHAALDDTHRKLSAGIPLVVTLIMDAKESGLAHVDLWGIAPEGQPDHQWAGFTSFKKSFGGHAVSYPGTWDLPVDKPRYYAYTGLRTARGYARKGLAWARTAPGKARELVAAARTTARGNGSADGTN
ncbi:MULTISPECIES: peptidoglycan bridge formation glycyltransferase FemA/FemB family protein [Arthrobacter]|uniref:Peptidoglycan bridge formation glycyltransferase FemA/FemB family protein n=2 Tax=Arthrobacter TaxID=1663 RepID=A0ABU9KLZ0_9MICC|nr:peptidoglycan bridge formation glycyltransferase FemA/FemB family protein [Arthrobacter sp. YJM1]MDP5227372.1 peptidoglycan bridge formation glycyltransferase FemA/FemB family protein [Arthrobacter sp. YJM1]